MDTAGIRTRTLLILLCEYLPNSHQEVQQIAVCFFERLFPVSNHEHRNYFTR